MLRQRYNELVRGHLPKKIGVKNGIPVREPRLLDIQDTFPDYKRPLVSQIREYIHDSETVVIVGGGQGVSTVSAANKVGPGGEVISFEPATKYFDICRETCRLANVEGIVDVRREIVGEGIEIFGSARDAKNRSPDELPVHDVLVLDCEGAERGIIQTLKPLPRRIIVETHSKNGSPPDIIRDTAGKRGYDLVCAVPDVWGKISESDDEVLVFNREQ